MDNISIKIFAASAVLAIISSTQAAEPKQTGSGPNPFSDCGIGAAIFSETKWAAVTSNVIWDLGTTAVTSATMSPQTCSGKQVKAAALINHTYDSLVEETAKGEGEHVAALLDIYQCSTNVRPNIINDVRRVVAGQVAAKTYAEESHREKAEAFYLSVNSIINGQYAASCTA